MNRRTKLSAATVSIAIIVLSLGLFAYFDQTTPAGQESTAATIRVACVGDSITNSTGYPDELWMLLGENYTVGNFGWGATTVSLSSRNPYMNQAMFQAAKDFQPDIVVIILGTNDAHPDNQKYVTSFVGNYLSLVRAFQELSSKPQIWIVKPPPIFHNGTGLSTEFFDTEIIPLIEQVAEQANVPLIDVYTALANHPDYFLDGVHPTPVGTQAIATEVYAAITST